MLQIQIALGLLFISPSLQHHLLFSVQASAMQNRLCSIMLSQWVIVVLTDSFITESWPEYEESIAHLTSLSQRRQRVVPVLLEDCPIPESLRSMQPIEATNDDFWETLFQSLQIGDRFILLSRVYKHIVLTTQQTRDIHPILFKCWPTVFDASSILKQHWMNAPYLLGSWNNTNQ